MTKTQIDKLGERLKADINEADLRLLDEYRRTYLHSYEIIVDALSTKLGLSPSGRPAKSTKSIVDKLRRESIRLTQMQDIAGCRLVVPDILEQDRIVNSIRGILPAGTLVDRRANPTFGYRAVHYIAKQDGKLIEIQIRTRLQQRWAEVSEKFSDRFEPGIKYGGGDELIRSISDSLSVQTEQIEAAMLKLNERMGAGAAENREMARDLHKQIEDAELRLNDLYQLILEHIGTLRRMT